MLFLCFSKLSLTLIFLFVTEAATQGLPRCGEVFTEKNSIISYKLSESIVPNERCIWIIGVPSAVSYDINITHIGFPVNPRGQILLLTGVSTGGIGTPEMTTYYQRSVGGIRVENAQLIIVTFYTTSSSIPVDTTGFALEYDATTTGRSWETSSRHSSHHIFEPNTFGFTYPPTGVLTAQNELAAFAFPPTHNIWDQCSKRVNFDVGKLGRFCYNRIFVYNLRIDLSPTTHPWILSERICARNATQEHQYNDTALAIFRSDSFSEGTTFGFSVLGC